MKVRAKDQILEFIKKNSEARPHDLALFLQITPAALHRHLKKMTEDGAIVKFGKPPSVFYRLAAFVASASHFSSEISIEESDFLERHYSYIDPSGNILMGAPGFFSWVKSVKEQKRVNALIQEYIKIREDANQYFRADCIDATERFKSVFPGLHLQKVFYQDFYSLPKFGKTKLGQFVLHGKQAQDQKIIRSLAEGCKDLLHDLCKREKIDAVAWSPHSLPRKLQFLKELERSVSLPLPKIEIIKAYSGTIPIAQKTLAKLDERIMNARETIIIKTNPIPYKNILLIDDAVGSGATLNETALKLKEKGAKRIIGFALVGSYKGFEVIREV